MKVLYPKWMIVENKKDGSSWVYPVRISWGNTTIYYRKFGAVGIDDEHSVDIEKPQYWLGDGFIKIGVTVMSCVD